MCIRDRQHSAQRAGEDGRIGQRDKRQPGERADEVRVVIDASSGPVRSKEAKAQVGERKPRRRNRHGQRQYHDGLARKIHDRGKQDGQHGARGAESRILRFAPMPQPGASGAR